MLAQWTRSVFARFFALFAACGLIVGSAWVASGGLGRMAELYASPAEDRTGDNANDPENSEASPVAASPNSNDTAVADRANNDKEAGLLSLPDAIELVKKTNRGEITRAEKIGAGADAHFHIEVAMAAGMRTQFDVNATGKVMVESQPKKSKQKTPMMKGEKKPRESERPEYEREREEHRRVTPTPVDPTQKTPMKKKRDD